MRCLLSSPKRAQYTISSSSALIHESIPPTWVQAWAFYCTLQALHVMLLNMYRCVWTGQYRLIVTLPVIYCKQNTDDPARDRKSIWCQINYQWYMELKIMEWDHPLSYFQRSASLWSSSELRKFSTDLQKQNNYLFNQTPFFTCFCTENSHFTSPIHSPLPQIISLNTCVGPPGALMLYYPTGKQVLPISRSFPLVSACSAAQHSNPFNHSSDPRHPQSHGLLKSLPSISLTWILFPCIPYSLLASRGLSHILHLPHHPGFQNLFFKPVWRASIGLSHLQLLSSPVLHAFRPSFQLQWYSCRLSFSQGKSKHLWAKPWADMHQLNSPVSREGCRLKAAEQLICSFALDYDCSTLLHWELRSSHYSSNGCN